MLVLIKHALDALNNKIVIMVILEFYFSRENMALLYVRDELVGSQTPEDDLRSVQGGRVCHS